MQLHMEKVSSELDAFLDKTNEMGQTIHGLGNTICHLREMKILNEELIKLNLFLRTGFKTELEKLRELEFTLSEEERPSKFHTAQHFLLWRKFNTLLSEYKRVPTEKKKIQGQSKHDEIDESLQEIDFRLSQAYLLKKDNVDRLDLLKKELIEQHILLHGNCECRHENERGRGGSDNLCIIV